MRRTRIGDVIKLCVDRSPVLRTTLAPPPLLMMLRTMPRYIVVVIVVTTTSTFPWQRHQPQQHGLDELYGQHQGARRHRHADHAHCDVTQGIPDDVTSVGDFT